MSNTLLEPGNLLGVSKQDNKIAPIEYLLNKIEKIKNDNNVPNVVILRSETGSGKSTLVPPYLYFRFKQTVACTQPRILTATNIAKYVASQHKSLTLGENIGYKTSIDQKESTGITFMTLGYMAHYARFLEPDVFLQKYKYIIIDEAHERTTDMDILLLALKRYVQKYKKRAPFIVIMSATIDVARYLKYFDLSNDHRVEVVGLNYPITSHYYPIDPPNFIDATVNLCIKIHDTDTIENIDDPHDILIFCAKTSHINKIYNKLSEIIKKRELPILVLQLTSELFKKQTIEYMKLVEGPLQGMKVNGAQVQRRIIIATNVAETGVTLAQLRHVLDTGYINSIEINPNYNARCEVSKPETLYMVQQRKGRVGRKHPGHWYPIFMESTYNELYNQHHADFIKTESTLALLSVNLVNDALIPTFIKSDTDARIAFVDIGTMDPIPMEQYTFMRDKLYALGFMQGDNTVTALGKIAGCFNKISAESIRMILSGYAYDICVADLITIAVGLERNIVQFTSVEVADQFLEILFTVEQWSRENKENEEYRELLSLRMEVLQMLSTAGLSAYNVPSIMTHFPERVNPLFGEILSTNSDIDDVLARFKRCVYEGYKLNLVKKVMSKGSIKFVNLRKQEVIIPAIYSGEYINFYRKYGINEVDAPNFMVCKGFKIIRKTGHAATFSYIADTISVLDGYVGVDESFFDEIPNKILCDPVSSTSFEKYYNLLPKGEKIYNKSLFDIPKYDLPGITSQIKLPPIHKFIGSIDNGDDCTLASNTITRNTYHNKNGIDIHDKHSDACLCDECLDIAVRNELFYNDELDNGTTNGGNDVDAIRSNSIDYYYSDEEL